MKDFIEKIEKIGFKKWIHVKNRTNHRYEYNNWFIDITSRITGGLPEYTNSDNCWHLTYTDGNPDPLKRV
jgi:hypothetical protein